MTAVQPIEAEHVVVWPWAFGVDVLATVIVPWAPPPVPKRPASDPLKVLTTNVRSSAMANGPANRLVAAEKSVVRSPSLRTHSYR